MLAVTLLCLLLQARSPQAADSAAEVPDSVAALERYHELRTRMLTTPYDELGIERSDSCPQVYGIVMDWPISGHTVTLLSFNHGAASVYSTGGFEIIGGEFHEFVRYSAKRWVKIAEQFYDDATPVYDYPLPESKHIRFYLLGYDGVRMIDAVEVDVHSDKHRHFPLWDEAQKVITELRLIVDQVETSP